MHRRLGIALGGHSFIHIARVWIHRVRCERRFIESARTTLINGPPLISPSALFEHALTMDLQAVGPRNLRPSWFRYFGRLKLDAELSVPPVRPVPGLQCVLDNTATVQTG